MNKKHLVVLAMAIPIIGWIYIAVGFVVDLEHPVLRVIWWADLAASAGLHPLQLFVALPLARRKGVGTARALVMTIIFGAVWWKPLREGIITK
ncbi:MAG: hypothetical protein JW838_12880 [Spirochaetes bacterium]|nr:hypothetical protein [Spirochaetota bacterium]